MAGGTHRGSGCHRSGGDPGPHVPPQDNTGGFKPFLCFVLASAIIFLYPHLKKNNWDPRCLLIAPWGTLTPPWGNLAWSDLTPPWLSFSLPWSTQGPPKPPTKP